MPKVSVVVPVYNEISMINEIYDRISAVFEKLKNYTYEIVFFDDGSTDGTRDAVEELSKKHEEVKGVFYTKNFGYLKNTFRNARIFLVQIWIKMISLPRHVIHTNHTAHAADRVLRNPRPCHEPPRFR